MFDIMRTEDDTQIPSISSRQIVDYFKNAFYSTRKFTCSKDEFNRFMLMIPEDTQFTLIGSRELTALPTNCSSCGSPSSLTDREVQGLLNKPDLKKDELLQALVQVLTPSTCGHCQKPLVHLEILGGGTTELSTHPAVETPKSRLPSETFLFPTFGRSDVTVGNYNRQDKVVGRTGVIGDYARIGFVGMSRNAEIARNTRIRHLVCPQITIGEPYTLGFVVASSFIAAVNPFLDTRSSIDMLLIAPGEGPVKIQNCDVGVLLVADHSGHITFGRDTYISHAFYATDREPTTGSNVTMLQEEAIDPGEMEQLFLTGVIPGSTPQFLENLHKFANIRITPKVIEI